jgi:hypothetical protein
MAFAPAVIRELSGMLPPLVDRFPGGGNSKPIRQGYRCPPAEGAWRMADKSDWRLIYQKFHYHKNYPLSI